MQMRERQMRIDDSEDVCIRNWTDKIAAPETRTLSAGPVILSTMIDTILDDVKLQGRPGTQKPPKWPSQRVSMHTLIKPKPSLPALFL